MESTQTNYYQKDNPTFSHQSVDEIMKIVAEARNPPPSAKSVGYFGWGAEEDDEKEEVDEEDVEEEEDEYEKRVKEVHASGEFNVI